MSKHTLNPLVVEMKICTEGHVGHPIIGLGEITITETHPTTPCIGRDRSVHGSIAIDFGQAQALANHLYDLGIGPSKEHVAKRERAKERYKYR